jgi:hypothetical protein
MMETQISPNPKSETLEFGREQGWLGRLPFTSEHPLAYWKNETQYVEHIVSVP